MTTRPDGEPEPPGWYGKLPSLGDFASRRLAPDFVETWDAWLAQGLADWQAADPDGWLAHYLDGPSWRFVLMPEVVAAMTAGPIPGTVSAEATGTRPAQPMAGVLMPSVDRVGRYFPFTVAWPLPRLPADGAELQSLLAALHLLDDLALDALQDDWPVDRLEAEFAALLPRLPAWAPCAPLSTPGADGDWRPTVELGAAFAAAACSSLHHAWRDQVIWLHDDGQGTPCLRLTTGLPQGAEFVRLLKRED